MDNWNGYLLSSTRSSSVGNEYYVLTGDTTLEDAASLYFTNVGGDELVSSGRAYRVEQSEFMDMLNSAECKGSVEVDRAWSTGLDGLARHHWRLDISYINDGKGGIGIKGRNYTNLSRTTMTEQEIEQCCNDDIYTFDFSDKMTERPVWNGSIITFNNHANREYSTDPVDRELMGMYDHISDDIRPDASRSYLLMDDMTMEEVLNRVGCSTRFDDASLAGLINKRSVIRIDSDAAEQYLGGLQLRECVDIYGDRTCIVRSINNGEGGIPYYDRNDANTKSFEFKISDYWLDAGTHVDISMQSGKKRYVKMVPGSDDPLAAWKENSQDTQENMDASLQTESDAQSVQKSTPSVPNSSPVEQYAPKEQDQGRNSVFINGVPVENIDIPAFAHTGSNPQDLKTVRIPLSTDAMRKLAASHVSDLPNSDRYTGLQLTGETDKYKVLSFAVDITPKRVINPTNSDKTRNVILTTDGNFKSVVKLEISDKTTGKSFYAPTHIRPTELAGVCNSTDIASVSTTFEKAKKRSEMTADELNARDAFDRKRFLNRVDNLYIRPCRFDGYKTVQLKVPGNVSDDIRRKLHVRSDEPFDLSINVRDKQIIANGETQTSNIVLCSSRDDPDNKQILVSVFHPENGRRGSYSTAHLSASDITDMHYAYYGDNRFTFEPSNRLALDQEDQQAEDTDDFDAAHLLF